MVGVTRANTRNHLLRILETGDVLIAKRLAKVHGILMARGIATSSIQMAQRKAPEEEISGTTTRKQRWKICTTCSTNSKTAETSAITTDMNVVTALTLVHALIAQDIVAAEAAATMIATEKLGQALEWKN